MTDEWSELRWVWIDGPPLEGGAPLWSLRLGAAYAQGNRSVDHIHPVRSLMIDGTTNTIRTEKGRKFFDGADDHPMRTPRLLSLHLAAGAMTGAWQPNADDEALQLCLTRDGQRCEIRNSAKSPVFTTPQAGIVHVLVEPILQKTTLGDFVDQAGETGTSDDKAIRMPRMRLIEGAIRLVLNPKRGQWLGNLDSAPSKPLELMLTGEGIQLVTMSPFPGQEALLQGGFMIRARQRRIGAVASSDSPVVLSLLPQHPETMQQSTAWIQAWERVSGGSDNPAGLAFRARSAGQVPAFLWAIHNDKGRPMLAQPDKAIVEVPPTDLHVELRGGPGTDGTPEGAARLRLSRILIATRDAAAREVAILQTRGLLRSAELPAGRAVVIAEAVPAAIAAGSALPSPKCWLDIGITSEANMQLCPGGDQTTIPLVHDERQLAANLRQAYGFPAPDPDASIQQPIVPGFVPLADGWLQLPLPNLPQLDARKDSALVSAEPSMVQSVLDGFIRVSHRMALARISAFPAQVADPCPIASVPWSMTLEAAPTAIVLAAMSDTGRLNEARVALRDPQLSLRGLLWLSTDRPDSVEALPRLSAGPGSFIAPHLRTAVDPTGRIVTATLVSRTGQASGDPLLSIGFGRQPDAKVRRSSFGLRFSFDAQEPVWLQGPAHGEAARIALAQAREVLLGAEPVPQPADLINKRQALVAAQNRASEIERNLAGSEARLTELSRNSAETRDRIAVAKVAVDRAGNNAGRPPTKMRGRRAMIARMEARAAVEAAERDAARIDFELNALKLNRDARLAAAAAAREDRNQAVRALAAIDHVAVLSAEPWPAVAWRCHPQLPLASAMPMTRSAASAVLPLESRALAPLVASAMTDDQGETVLATLNFAEQGEGLAALSAAPAFVTLADGWPRQESGIPFAALGVPGVEVYPAPGWDRMNFAARYDLPPLDEAFATAGLPDAPDAATATGADLATALDWVGLGRFWARQSQRRNLSMVVDSYLAPFSSGQQKQHIQIGSLVRDARWTVEVSFEVAKEGLSYGSLCLGDLPALSGNAALRGLSGRISLNDKVRDVGDDGRFIDLLGWSPSTWDKEGFRFDNQGMGVATPTLKGDLLCRPFRRGEEEGHFISALATIAIQIGERALAFWYRDVPIDGNGRFSGRGQGVDPKAWEDPRSGMEWRLFDASAGGEQIALFGLRFEPLRLMSLDHGPASERSHVPAEVSILARVSLPLDGLGLATGGNLVTLHLTRSGNTLHLREIKADQPLVFSIPPQSIANHTGQSASLSDLVLTFTLGWKSPTPSFDEPSLQGSLLGVAFSLDRVSVRSTDGQSLRAEWDGPKSALVAGQACLRMERIEINLDGGSNLVLITVIEISLSNTAKAAITIDSASLFCLGVKLSAAAMRQDAEGALVMTASGTGQVAAILQGFKGDEHAAFDWMFAAHVKADQTPGIFLLEHGRCEGEVRMQPHDGSGLRPSCIRWCVEGDETWQGGLEISGSLQATSAISWPVLHVEAQTGSPRHRVTATGTAKSHEARYLLCAHRLPFDHCAWDSGAWSLAKPWLVLAHVEHVLGSSRWTGVETLALGSAQALVRKPGVRDAMTFAPRYRSFPGGPDGMVQPGIGAVEILLRGSVGAAFRNWFWQAQPSGDDLLAIGGFVGLLHTGSGQDTRARLLRLPFLAGLSGTAAEHCGPGILAQLPSGAGLSLTAADVAPTDLSIREWPVPSAAGLRQQDLLTALAAASEVVDDFMPAIAVEQSFPDPTDSAHAPFWIAAAVTLAPIIDTALVEPPLSIIAGSEAVGARREGRVAILRGLPSERFTQPAEAVPAQQPLLISGGGRLRVEDWGGADPKQGDLSGQIAARMAELHAQPLFAIIRASGESTSYHAFALPRRLSGGMPRPRLGSRLMLRQPEIARGYPLDPGAKTGRWMRPVLDGPIAALRDDIAAQSDDEPSGIAGLGRHCAFPAQAAAEQPPATVAGDLVWFAETRLPVYASLALDPDFEAPPIPWLTTAPIRARLPADADVAGVLKDYAALQAFLPAAADTLAVGERAGVITARRAMLMAPIPGAPAFDDQHGRFGRPAQAGSSARRWMRTPRPGSLPANTGNPLADRRPQASPILHDKSLCHISGVADTMRGRTESGILWSLVLRAAPATSGLLSDDWDGSLRFQVVIHCLPPFGLALDAPDAFLTKQLFPKSGQTARGTIHVGSMRLPLRWITIETQGAWQPVLEHGTGTTHDLRQRAEVGLVLDANNPALSATGLPHSTLAAALRSGATQVEISLTLPLDGTTDAIKPGAAFRLIADDDSRLAAGDRNPPVTLRWSLPVVNAESGGFPVLPATAIFCDPAYDADISHPPEQERRPIQLVDNAAIVADRGGLYAVLSADRSQVNPQGDLCFMLDFRFERSKRTGGALDDDFTEFDGALHLQLNLVPGAVDAKARPLYLSGAPSRKPLTVVPNRVHSCDLAWLFEENGAPVSLTPGDTLELSITGQDFALLSDGNRLPLKEALPIALRIRVTADPVAEPPSALYALLARDSQGRISLPLHAQSPLPRRLDFTELKADFRRGLIRQSASFVWRVVARPGTSLYILKMDRSGQCRLPDVDSEFLPLENP